ncbi:hypothetical protein SAMN05421684_7948 [Asanoa ishikariensis]|uniref:Uncharacterized protein n=1 Tax=Asanoa ishikariensis TaxID=137265 RepID=A0A1H3UTK1_9ACTN|nr:hypothetical protein [Asanoa ishikariensis]SDZ65165.1 hypothetical protein SAMN05421684_7948 [Asanoa ishikariensis]
MEKTARGQGGSALAELVNEDLEEILADASPALRASLERQYSADADNKFGFCSFLDADL